MSKTEVTFRKDKKDNEIMALLPYEIATLEGLITCVDYNGHSAASLEYYTKNTKLATPEEYSKLKSFLESHYEYDFKVIKRMNYSKYIRAYEKLNHFTN